MYSKLVGAVLLLGSFVSAQTPPNFEFPSIVSTTHLNVSYPAFTKDIVPGQILDLATVRAQPQPVISYSKATNATTRYTLIMFDPDARNPNGTARQVLHWLQGNITSATPLSLPNATAVATYRAPGPPPEVPTRAHRYIQLLFAKPLVVPASYVPIIQARVPFDIEKFVKDAGLGPVVAANYYLTRNDSLVNNGTVKPIEKGTANGLSVSIWGAVVVGGAGLLAFGGML